MLMLIVGDCMGIRSERRLCEEVHLDLACRWFCRLGLDGKVPDHSTFSRNRHGRFRQSDILRRLFETVVERCLRQGLVGGYVSWNSILSCSTILLIEQALNDRAGWHVRELVAAGAGGVEGSARSLTPATGFSLAGRRAPC